MKRHHLPAFLACLFLSACTTAPMVHNGVQPSPAESYGDVSARMKPKATDATNIVTAGLRSGSGAIDRSNIDAVLNSPPAPRKSANEPRVRPAEERPGLATGYGDVVNSPWNRQSFTRASSKPDGTDMLYYNDQEGIDAMSGSYKSSIQGARRASGEKLEWGIKGTFGYLPAYSGYYSRSFVVGKKNSNYSVVLKNRCKSRLEVVLSVDGLDVIDGKTASMSKRGYVIAPGETMEVKGWRTSMDSVARFRFSTVAGSYANLAHGETRNVGVVGIAVFTEKGVDPWTWMPDEIRVRDTASPFAKSP